MDSDSDASVAEILEIFRNLSADQLKELREGAENFMEMYSKTYGPPKTDDLEVRLEQSIQTQLQMRHDFQHLEYELKQEVKEAKQELEQVKAAKKSVEEALAKKYETRPEVLTNIHQDMSSQAAKDQIKNLKEDIKDLTCDNRRLYLTGEAYHEQYRIEREDFERKLKIANETVESSTAILNLVARDLEAEKKKKKDDEEIQKLLKEKEELKAKSTLHKIAHLETQKLLDSTDVEFQKALTVIGRQELELEDLRRVRDELEDVNTPDAKKILNLTVYFHESRKRMIEMNAEVNEGKARIQNLEDIIEGLRKNQKALEKEHLEEVNELQMILEKQDDELEKLKMELENSGEGTEDVSKFVEDSGDSDGWRPLDDSDGEILKE